MALQSTSDRKSKAPVRMYIIRGYRDIKYSARGRLLFCTNSNFFFFAMGLMLENCWRLGEIGFLIDVFCCVLRYCTLLY